MTALKATKMSTRTGVRSKAALPERTTSRRSPPALISGTQAASLGRVAGRMSQQAGVCRASAEETARMMDEQMKRLEAQVQEGKIKAVNAAEVGNLLSNGWVLLDVRPPEETNKGHIEGSVEVPLFVTDDDMSPGGLLKQMSAFGMGGWWLGNRHMKLNTKFMGSVRKGIPTDSSVIVACQKGLRSLSACEQLAKNGYSKVAWVTGGLDTAEPGDLPVKDGKDIRFAGNGGVSDLVGWTEAHRKANKDQSVLDGPFGIVLKVAIGILALDFVSFVFEQVKNFTSQ
ncbi:rhodanese-like domain-containing protein [Chloropicon primus]|uniref:Rhodanese-like domain-containing protein n=2 Tax=Chloropicon primus TaxID=1764295 RepID=A0A5B8MT53_9CHLO|nr:rhodanese-like domain-containing protein [Chloropicon primus]UPR03022.1 rhodanese-like domain-containing protein [Chloropicon primus]|eukprot:QDZ23809.1 rhodanese-like domain-containing protein [Chloropicon primus]